MPSRRDFVRSELPRCGALHGKGYLATETRKRLSWLVATHKAYNGIFKLLSGRLHNACGWLVAKVK